LNYTFSEENYLKAIYHLQETTGTVSTNALAAKLCTKPSSVTDMMKKLSAKELLLYKPYYGFSLTNEGRKIALNVIRRHRLWEYFLAEKLDFGWDEVHQVAEELEHISNKKLVEKLDAYLGFPQFDPHGDPIPDSKGKFSAIEHISLNELALSQPAIISSVSNQSKELLEELNERKIAIGTALEIRKRSSFDHSLNVRIRNRNTIITEQLAKNIFVKKIKDGTA
jgi:DtxR family transcriptional regulator, Mn-dependent transcriptional regulator